MPLSHSDPRVYFAAERTLLAWLRTGLTVIALGFVIARFGLFLQIVSAQSHAARVPSDIPALLGVVLVGAGAAMILAATLQHRRFIATLPAQDRPRNYSGGGLIFVSSLLVTLIGIVLAVYLALSTARP